MQVTVENTSAIGRRLTVSIPVDEVKSEVKKKLNDWVKRDKRKGFRAGNVPRELVQKEFGPQIRQEAISGVIESSLPAALEQESLEPAGRPELEKVLNSNEEDKDLTYVVHFEVYPQINLPSFSEIKIEQLQTEINDADVDKTIESIRSQLGVFNPVERAAKLGDRLTLDYTSLLNGKPYKNSSSKGAFVELGTNLFIPGFEEGLLGVKAGETRELELTFPPEWRMENLANKPVHFTITVTEVAEKKLADINEEFAKKVGAESSNLADIQRKVRESLEKQVKHKVSEDMKMQAIEQLVNLSEVPVPKALIEHEMSQLHEDMHRRMGDKAHEACHHEGLEEEAIKRVTLSLLLREIVKSENLTADKEKMQEKILEISKSFGNAEFIENMYYESKELLAKIQNVVLVDQAIDLVLAKATKLVKPTTVDALFERALQLN